IYLEIQSVINALEPKDISSKRKEILQPLVDFIQAKVAHQNTVQINFICTHNSRRSHLAQLWARVAIAYFNTPNIHCHSGGTKETAFFPKVAETLSNERFNIFKIAESNNPIYALK